MQRLLASALFFTVLAACQDVHPVSGRRIAPVMGVGGADWLTRPERAEQEHPDEALDLIGIPKGAVVADVGAGVGYYSAKLAQRVGPEGKVYANDIQMSMLERLRQNMALQHITNVIPVLSAEDDPRLPKDQMDLVLLVDVYHEFSKPVAMIDHIRDSLKPGGRLVLLEYREEDPDVPIKPEHKMSVKTVRKELEPQGLKFEKSIEKLPWQHILIFRKSNDTGKPIGGLAWLVGGVWTADASKMGGGMQRIETRYHMVRQRKLYPLHDALRYR